MERVYPTDSAYYFPLARIGTGDGGGGGVVYRTTCHFPDEETFEVVALKKINGARNLHGVEVEHPNLNGAYCVFEEGGATWAVMPYVKGCSALGLMLARRHGLQERTIAALLKGVLTGIAFLHSRNIFHQDLKPTNILIDLEGEVKISDTCLSLSHYNQNPPRGYWSVPVKNHLNSKDDIYAIGVLAMELAYGRAPIFIPTAKRLSDDSSRFSLEFKTFVSSCLETEPMDRPEAEQLLLNTFLQDCRDTSAMKRIVKSVFNRVVRSKAPSFSFDGVGPIMKWKFCEKEFKLYPVLEGGGEIEKKGARELYLECAHKLFLDQPNLIGLDEYNELRKIGDGGLSGVLGQGLKMFFRQSIRCVTEVEMDLTELCLDFSKQTVCKDKAEVDMSKLQSQIEQLSKFSSSIGSTSLQLISTDLLSCCDDENLEK